ncbi:MAG: cobalamin-dependent protein [Melioribacteraceae bacterium]|nr:cobalamin-dependent protein [Melioribacteraceae bacterium]
MSESIYAGKPELFNEYLKWAKIFFANLSVSDEDIILNLELLKEALAAKLPPEMNAITSNFINEGIAAYKSQPKIPSSYIDDFNPNRVSAENYLNYLIMGEKKAAYDLIMSDVNNGVSIRDIYLNIFQVTQRETGRLWQMNKISVAQEHYITAVTQLIMSQLYPFLFTGQNNGKRIIVSCINGELHELAPRMVADLFELDGWNSYFYGANTPQESLIKEIASIKPDLLAISATMTFNLLHVEELIKKVKNNPETKDIKIFVGGYPFLIAEGLWKDMGADGTAIDALSAIELANQLTN